MCHRSLTGLPKILLMVASLGLLQACTTTSGDFTANSTASVEEAFLTTGIVPLKPYTRTVFSSTNF